MWYTACIKIKAYISELQEKSLQTNDCQDMRILIYFP